MEFEIHHYDGIFEVRTYGDAEFGKFRDILEYGMGRIWEAFVEDKWDASEELFRSREEAIE
ncbi:MAG: hypothetical protein ACQEQ7_13590, partial [Thermodesulfobacteriota bacterium]